MSKRTDHAAATQSIPDVTTPGAQRADNLDSEIAREQSEDAAAAVAKMRAETPEQSVVVEGLTDDKLLGLVIRDIDTGKALRTNRIKPATRYAAGLKAGEILYMLVLVGEALQEFERAEAEVKAARAAANPQPVV